MIVKTENFLNVGFAVLTPEKSDKCHFNNKQDAQLSQRDHAIEILNTLEIQYVQCKVSIHSSDSTLDIAPLLRITVLLFVYCVLHNNNPVANSSW